MKLPVAYMADAIKLGSYLARALSELRAENYKPSKEEIEIADRCRDRLKTVCVNAFLAAGSSLWLATGRVQLLQRLIATFAGASAGALLSYNWAAGHCAEEFLAVDGGQLQKRLIAILQNEAVHKPHVRAILEKHYYVEPLYDDSGPATPGIVLRKREVAGVKAEEAIEEVDSFGRDLDPLKIANKTSLDPKEDVVEQSPTKKSEENRINVVQGHKSDDALTHEDLLKDLLWSEAEASSKASGDGKASRKHTGKMGVLERREYNRARYLQWQEKQNASGWGNAQQA